MRLIITRHGETEENKNGIIQGHLPGKLSKIGQKQAEKVALRLKDYNIDFIYSSDLLRASDTAKIIHKFNNEIPILFVRELREKYLGSLQGMRVSDLNLKDTRAVFAKDGESQDELVKRAKSFLLKIISKHKSEVVLLVAHNGINKALISVITGEDMSKLENQKNTAVNIFDIKEDMNFELSTFNCAEHLN